MQDTVIETQNGEMAQVAPSEWDCLIAELGKLRESLRAMSPFPDRYISLSAETRGFPDGDASWEFYCYFGENAHLRAETIGELVAKIRSYAPEIQKKKRIAALEAELAQLKGGAQ